MKKLSSIASLRSNASYLYDSLLSPPLIFAYDRNNGNLRVDDGEDDGDGDDDDDDADAEEA